MRSKFKWIFTLLVAFSLQIAFAQQKTVTGTVTSAADKMPLPFVNVKVQGVAGGIQTDIDGKYSISVSVGQTLEFSFTGMQTVAQKVGANSTINITMQEDSTLLDDVVVVGYGTTTKEQFTGTAAKVDMKSVQAKTQSNITQALRGEVAGVNVITTNGAPGSDATIRIRGFGSVNGNRDPLYVVDGAPFSSDISAINPADIENMTILKDAAATSIYGSRGANGVILITTKKGKAGKSVISVDFKTSINTQMLPTYSVIDSPEEYIETAWSAQRNRAFLNGEANPAVWASNNLYATGTTTGIDPHYNIWNVDGSQLIDPATGKVAAGVQRKYTPTKWSDAAFRTAYRQEANLQMSGGNETTHYATSFGYLEDEGYAINSSYKRYTARLSVDHKPKDWLKVAGNMAYTGGRYVNSSSDENSSGSSGNIFALTSTTPAIYDVYLRDDNANLVADPIFGGSQYDYGGLYGRRAWNLTNAIADSNYDLAKTESSTLLGNFNINVDLTKGLTFETRYSGQLQTYNEVQRNNPFYGGWSGADTYGFLYNSRYTETNQNFLQLLRYNKAFGQHSFEAFVAHETTKWQQKRMEASKTHVILPQSPESEDLDNYTSPYGVASSYTLGYTLESYFAQLNYNYAQKYFLTGSVRRDGSSRFINDKWGTFGSVGLGWVVSKENFLSKASFVDYLKLKASWGVIGDQGTSLRYGWQILNINQTDSGDYSFTPTNELANPDLTWETSYISQVGFESTLFDFLDVNVEYYVKDTKNLFFTQQLSLYEGYETQQYNDGKMRNSGLEFDVAAQLIKSKSAEDFSLTVGVNGEFLKNEILEMPKDQAGQPKILNGTLAKGHSIFDFYMREWAGVDPATGEGLWNLYYNDMNSNGVFDSSDEAISTLTIYESTHPDANVQKTTTNNLSQATQKFVGKSSIPTVRGAFRVNATYKNFDISTQFGYSIGGYVYDNGYSTLMSNSNLIGSDNWSTDIRNAWQQPGDITNVPRLSSGYAVNDTQVNGTSTRFLTKADYLSINNVRLGYTLPSRFIDRMDIKYLNLYVSGDNLAMWSARKGLNPQTISGNANNSGIYMPMTTFSLGAKIEF
ncbi:SusC/RagA family TonB-linked outer membrane protein [Flavobacterium silvaticum]|uniref:SusC/RagA family TonB-linked outer membrane protein n=1 Tax=Flavobacterium silvaticum TaxID=1852020 RepID=A0A972FK61_9FLAO|nr:SusC/RagA family TonB-linked outer membrane protein [Flavobacterium silvaticum]NMH26710.1 SusC/RagA family TonB-linked outer membrane protein [Flavobacterium silvaticum]